MLLVYEPVDPPRVRERLLKLVNGHDPRWGRNGHEWMGRHRKRHGGTALDRAREYAVKYRFFCTSGITGRWSTDAVQDWPVHLSPEEVALILGEKRLDGLVAKPPSPSVDLGQLPLFGEGK